MASSKSTAPVIVFLGSPATSADALRKLAQSKQYNIAAVITQPDRPAGRGQQLTPPPVKVVAEELGLKIFQPHSLKSVVSSGTENHLAGAPEISDVIEFLNSQATIDAFLVVAFGQILPMAFLNRARCGGINVHFSLLPRWRGAAPIQHAILQGDSETGVCIMQLEAGLDTGPVYACQNVKIETSDNWGTLERKLSKSGAELLLKTLPEILQSTNVPNPQAEEGVTYASKWTNNDREIHWSETAEVLSRRIRACAPVLGARAKWKGELFKIFQAVVVKNQNYPQHQGSAEQEAYGKVVECNKAELVLEAGRGKEGERTFLSLLEVQFPGKKRLPIAEMLKSTGFQVGDRFE